MRKLALLLLLSIPLLGQPTSTARRIVHGTSVPSTCAAGDVFFSTTSSSAYVCATTNTWVVGVSSAGSAPSNATYITKQVEAGLSAEQSLGALTTGLVKNTVAASVGTLSTAVAGTDFVGGQASLTTQYAVPYVSSTAGVLAQGTLLHQCSSGVVGIGGCTSSYPGLKPSGGILYLKAADDLSPTSVVVMNLAALGRIISAGQTVTFSATPAFNASLYNTFQITLTGNVTSSTLTGTSAWQYVNWLIIEDATGGHSFVWPTNVKGGMSILTDANAWNLQTFLCNASTCYAVSAGRSGT